MNKRSVFALLVAAAAVAGFALWNRHSPSGLPLDFKIA